MPIPPAAPTTRTEQIAALKRNMRLSGFDEAARNVEEAIAEDGLPCLRDDVAGSRVLIHQVADEMDAWAGPHAKPGELVAILLCSGRRANLLLCSEREVLHRRLPLAMGRPRQTWTKPTHSVRLSDLTVRRMLERRPDLVHLEDDRVVGISSAIRACVNAYLALPEDV
jgi:hypothetical protein